MSFALTMIAFIAGALFLYLERDRVLPEFGTVLRVGTVYLVIAAINYGFMKGVYEDGVARGVTKFPTAYRYVDWLLTTPLMLLKFPLLLGIGSKGRGFMARLVGLDIAMILAGYVGEVTTTPALHHGFFLLGCVAWFAILALLFSALSSLPERTGPSVRAGVKTMALFVVIGWAIYPVGFFTPMLGVPDEARELIYNFADLFNKLGLCGVVYATAVGVAREQATAEREAGELLAAEGWHERPAVAE